MARSSKTDRVAKAIFVGCVLVYTAFMWSIYNEDFSLRFLQIVHGITTIVLALTVFDYFLKPESRQIENEDPSPERVRRAVISLVILTTLVTAGMIFCKMKLSHELFMTVTLIIVSFILSVGTLNQFKYKSLELCVVSTSFIIGTVIYLLLSSRLPIGS